jgi:hypothetical protein
MLSSVWLPVHRGGHLDGVFSVTVASGTEVDQCGFLGFGFDLDKQRDMESKDEDPPRESP